MKTLTICDRTDHCNWTWPLTGILPLEPPVPAHGAEGFRPWEEGGHA